MSLALLDADVFSRTSTTEGWLVPPADRSLSVDLRGDDDEGGGSGGEDGGFGEEQEEGGFGDDEDDEDV